VLLVSTDPAHSLGDVLGVRIGPRVTRVGTPRGGLRAVELDADRALARWMAERRAVLRTVALRGTYLDAEDVDRFLQLSLPGVDELIGLVELHRLAGADAYDQVVVDTAPTGHTLRLLAMPETLVKIASVLDDMQAKHRYMAASLGGRYRADAADALIDALSGQGQELGKTLRDPRAAAFSWVLLPERLALEEAKDGIRALDEAGITVSEVVVNRVTPEHASRCAHCAETFRAEAGVLAAVRAAFPGRPIRHVPAEPTEPRGIAALRRVARGLTTGPSAGFARAILPGGRQGGARREARDDRRKGGRAPLRVDRGYSAAGDRAWLDIATPSDAKLFLVAGKGGVGKTSCAATIALGLAERRPGTRILVLSTDPAHSLADALGVPLGDQAKRIPGAPAALHARELDAERAFRPIRERYRRAVDRLFESLRRGSRFDVVFDRTVARDLIDLAPPGLDELIAVLSILDVLVPPKGGSPAYDVVVLDLAPTGHALRLLAMPEAALEWVRALLAVLLKYRQVIGLGDLAADLVETSRGLRTLGDLLRDPRCTRAIVVTRPAELPRLETARLLEGLRRLGIRVAAVVANAVTIATPACARCVSAARREAPELRALARMGHPLIVAPSEAPPPTGVAALRRWGGEWSCEPQGGGSAR